MPQDIRIWNVAADDSLDEIRSSRLDSESRLEQWLEGDIGMVADDLLIIGRQVETDYGGFLDYLCMDGNGDLVIVELKRDRTPRDVTAQVLDYASWVKELSNDQIGQIADEYLSDKGPLVVAFRERFNGDLPDTLNQSHRMLIVASKIDVSTERIVRYLSEAGIGVNVITVQHFTAGDASELMARVFLIEPEEVSTRVRARSKRAPNLTDEQLETLAHDNGVGIMYDRLVKGLGDVFGQRGTTRRNIAFKARFDQSTNTVFNLIPGESDADRGLRFEVYSLRLAKHLGIETTDVAAMLPADREDWIYVPGAGPEWSGFTGYFKSDAEADKFLDAARGAL